MSTLAWIAPGTNRRGAFVARVARELMARQRTLTIFAAILLLALVPAAILMGIDDRELRGVSVWIKPMKFLLSIAVLALTTAWFIGHLPRDRQDSRAVRVVVAGVIATGAFEAIYIALQAALGQGSHYNVGTPFHATMYTLMGIGALLLTATQALLAWQLYRHPRPDIAPAYRLSVLLGLVLTFVLGAGVGFLLGGLQPPTGASLPVVGWSLVGGDLRPAHFVGVHAEQFLPAAGLLLTAAGVRQGRFWVWVLALAYSGLCIALVAQALAGHPLVRV
jgi:hypothetical protein